MDQILSKIDDIWYDFMANLKFKELLDPSWSFQDKGDV